MTDKDFTQVKFQHNGVTCTWEDLLETQETAENARRGIKPGGIKVLRDFLCVQEVKETDSPSKVIEIVRNDTRILKAKVVGIGTGVLTAGGTKHPLEVKVGDVVVFDRMNGREITHNGEKYLIINELSIFAVLT